MNFMYLALNWTFGAIFLLTGLISIIESPLAGLSLVILSLVLLSPVRKYVHSKTNKEISIEIRAVSIFILIIFYDVFLFFEQSQYKNLQEMAAQQAKENAKAEFAEIRTKKLLNRLKKLLPSDYLASKRIYQYLVILHPNNQAYKNKVEMYSEKIEKNKPKNKQKIEKTNKKKSELNKLKHNLAHGMALIEI